MQTIFGQILGGTRLDRHGERISKVFFDKFCASYVGVRMPLHQRHDMASQPLGYIENLRVEPSANAPDEFNLVGDVTFLDTTSLDNALTGFSISGMDDLRPVQNPEICLHLPFPLYNDEALVAELATDSVLTIGKWIKKDAGVSITGIFWSTLVFAMHPVWHEIYHRKIAPPLDRFLERHGALLKRRGIELEYVQLVKYESHTIEIRLIPKGGDGLSPENRFQGVSVAIEALQNDPRSITPGAARAVLIYYPNLEKYILHRIEFIGGEVRSFTAI